MHPRRVALLLGSLAFAALLIGLRDRAQQRMPAAAFPVDATTSAGPASPAAAGSSPAAQTADLLDQLVGTSPTPATAPIQTAATLMPLPRWDANLADVLPELRARADGGDVIAACHLGLALSACALNAVHKPSPARMRNVDPSDRDGIDDVARSSVDYMRPGREATCAGVSTADLDARFVYLRRAAEAGSSAAMLAYIEGVQFYTADAVIRHAEWVQQYRVDLPRYVAQLLQRGNRRAALLLALGADGQLTSILAQTLQLDAQAAATMYELGLLVREQSLIRVVPVFTADQHRIGRARAKAIYTRYFVPNDDGPYVKDSLADLMRVETCAEPR